MAELAAQARTLYAETRIERTDVGVVVSLTPPKPAVLIGFLTVWFIGWTFGGISAIGGLLRGGFGLATLFLLVWLIGWLAGETIVGGLLAYLLAGEHVLSFTPDGLTRKQHVLGVGLTWHYLPGRISGLEASTTGEPGHKRTALAFDYSGTSVAINLDVTPADADRIVSAVLAAFPHYG